MNKVKRMTFAICFALILSSGMVFAQETSCSGPRLMTLMMASNSIVICAIFGPIGCAGYATIVVSYQIAIWVMSGC